VCISHQPLDLAEYVLNKCITQPHPERQISISGENFVENNPTVTADQPVHYNFEHLEGKDAPISNKDNGNHILLWMVSWNIVRMWEYNSRGSFKSLIVMLLIIFSLVYLLVTTFKYILPRPYNCCKPCSAPGRCLHNILKIKRKGRLP